jgi:hypothetical protein
MLWVFASTMCNNAVTFYKKKISILSNGGGGANHIFWVTSATLRKLKKKERGKSAEAHFTLGPKNWPNSKVHMGFGPKAPKVSCTR